MALRASILTPPAFGLRAPLAFYRTAHGIRCLLDDPPHHQGYQVTPPAGPGRSAPLREIEDGQPRPGARISRCAPVWPAAADQARADRRRCAKSRVASLAQGLGSHAGRRAGQLPLTRPGQIGAAARNRGGQPRPGARTLPYGTGKSFNFRPYGRITSLAFQVIRFDSGYPWRASRCSGPNVHRGLAGEIALPLPTAQAIERAWPVDNGTVRYWPLLGPRSLDDFSRGAAAARSSLRRPRAAPLDPQILQTRNRMMARGGWLVRNWPGRASRCSGSNRASRLGRGNRPAVAHRPGDGARLARGQRHRSLLALAGASLTGRFFPWSRCSGEAAFGDQRLHPWIRTAKDSDGGRSFQSSASG